MRVPLLTAALLLLGLARSQTIPLYLGLEEGVRIIAFVAEDCAPCTALPSRLFALSPQFLGSSETLGYHDYVRDLGDVAARTMRVTTYPTVIVLRHGQEVIRQVGFIDPEVLAATVVALESGAMKPTWYLDISFGTRVAGPLHDFTGLLVYWRGSCERCEHTLPQLEELATFMRVALVRADGEPSERIQVTGQIDLLGEEALADWTLPGGLVHVYLSRGVPMWIGAGHFEDLTELVTLVVEIVAVTSVE